jgi:hypothetical protein
MTLPDERTRSLLKVRQFLLDLNDPKKTPRVPKEIRQLALDHLKHFPGTLEIQDLHKKLPKLFGKIKK